MLLDLRQTHHSYIIRIIFLGLIVAMLFGSVLSAVIGGGSNPILLKSSVAEIRRRDLFSRGGQSLALVFQQLNQDQEDFPALLNQYLLPKIYQDFFTHYGFQISDRLAWDLFLQQFESQELTAEKINAINQAIQQQYGSRSQFIAQLKVQLYTIALQEALYHLGQPIISPLDVQQKAEKLQRHVHVYTYLPQDFYTQVPQPTQEELQDFYQKNTYRYVQESSLSVEYFLLSPMQMILPQEESAEYLSLVAQLQARGYEEVTPLLLQQEAYHALLNNLDSWDGQQSIAEAQQVLAQYGVAVDKLSVQKLSEVCQESFDELFEQPGLYNVAQNIYLSYQQPLHHYSIGTDQELFLFVADYEEEGIKPYETIAYQVQQDWKHAQAFERTLAYVQNSYEQYCTDPQPSQLTAYHHHKELVVGDIFSDHRLDSEMKVALSTLYDPRLGLEKSMQVIQSDDGDHINFVVMDELSLQKPNLEDEQPIEPLFRLDEFAQQKLLHKIVDKDLFRNFGYAIVNPEFWSLVQQSA